MRMGGLRMCGLVAEGCEDCGPRMRGWGPMNVRMDCIRM